MTTNTTVDPRFHAATSTWTYVVADDDTGDAVVIDPVLDFDPASGRVWTETLDELLAMLTTRGLTLRGVIETHVHADHLTGAAVLKERAGARVAISDQIVHVQRHWAPIFGLDVPTDGSQFDLLAPDGARVVFGSLGFEVAHTPGHTAACATWRIGDCLFSGDAMFVPDSGVGRCDFPGGSADALYTSVHERLYALPVDLRVFVGHDYQPGGRAPQAETTIGDQRLANTMLPASRTREEFVAARTARDRTLPAPRLLLPSLQVNLDAGHLPRPRADGRRVLVLPLTVG